MWPYAIAAVVGALAANSRAPKTAITKSKVMGQKSGHKWDVEYLDDLGAMVVMGGGARAAFRKVAGGWEFVRGTGPRNVVETMKGDF